MANTYTLINSTSLSSSAASVTFSAIPATYDDLCLVASIRSDRASSTFEEVVLRFDTSGTASTYSRTYIEGNGATASSSRSSSTTDIRLRFAATGATATTSTFSNIEVYIPSYRVNQNKPVSAFTAHETNATTAYLGANAGLWRDTSAISTIVLTPVYAANFVSGSTFWLYGIKNS